MILVLQKLRIQVSRADQQTGMLTALGQSWTASEPSESGEAIIPMLDNKNFKVGRCSLILDLEGLV